MIDLHLSLRMFFSVRLLINGVIWPGGPWTTSSMSDIVFWWRGWTWYWKINLHLALRMLFSACLLVIGDIWLGHSWSISDIWRCTYCWNKLQLALQVFSSPHLLTNNAFWLGWSRNTSKKSIITFWWRRCTDLQILEQKFHKTKYDDQMQKHNINSDTLQKQGGFSNTREFNWIRDVPITEKSETNTYYSKAILLFTWFCSNKIEWECVKNKGSMLQAM